jgi:hypothetical protein
MNMFTIRKFEFMRILNGHTLNKVCTFFIPVVLGVAVMGSPPIAFADDAVNLKVLVITTGDEDSGLAYIKPVLDEMGVRYDLLNAATQELTNNLLSADGCLPATVGCVGNYNGVILTDSGMLGGLTALEWDLLHDYEKTFMSAKQCCQDAPALIGIKTILGGYTWITVLLIHLRLLLRLYLANPMLSGQCLTKTVRVFLSMLIPLTRYRLAISPTQPSPEMMQRDHEMAQCQALPRCYKHPLVKR